MGRKDRYPCVAGNSRLFQQPQKPCHFRGTSTPESKEEISTKETIEIRGSYFYAKTLTPSESDAEALAQPMNDEEGIVESAGAKLCGGFHPDFALQWNDSDGRIFEALICFGCSGIMFYGAGTKLYAEMDRDTPLALYQVLSAYGGQRPKIEKKN